MRTIYGLCEPETGRLRYIGMTRLTPERRLKAHIQASRWKKPLWPVNHWIRELLAQGKAPIPVAIATTDKVGFFANVIEAEIIRKLCKGHDLLNVVHNSARACRN